MLRKIGAVLIGYAVFVLSSLLLFKLTDHKPHAPATTLFQLLTALYGTIFSLLSGWLVQIMAKHPSLTLNYVLGGIIAGFATFSLFKAEGSHWTQLLAMFLFAPASLLGGLIGLKRT